LLIASFFNSALDFIKSKCPTTWTFLCTVIHVDGNVDTGLDENPKVRRMVMSWGGLMKIRSKNNNGVPLVVGLSMFIQGCHDTVFRYTNFYGLSCSYRNVTDFLDETQSQLSQVNTSILSNAFISLLAFNIHLRTFYSSWQTRTR